MKEKKAVTYESPYTREMQVSLESGICAGSIKAVISDNNGGIVEHEVNDNFSGGFYDNDSWD